MPNVDSTLHHISQWKYIIKTDLTSAFYQIPFVPGLDEVLWHYHTLQERLGVYVWSAMGMQGTETALKEHMCRIFGIFLQEGKVVKITDDLYCGANTKQELLQNWK